MAHEIWTWNESTIAGIIRSEIEETRHTFHEDFSMPSDATLAKLARWGKACALWQVRIPTYSGARLAVAQAMRKLYVGMDEFRRALLSVPSPVPNDETLACAAHTIGRRIGGGRSAKDAFMEVLAEFLADSDPFLRADGTEPFEDMARFDSLNRP